jgi:hypothetical protein
VFCGAVAGYRKSFRRRENRASVENATGGAHEAPGVAGRAAVLLTYFVRLSENEMAMLARREIGCCTISQQLGRDAVSGWRVFT